MAPLFEHAYPGPVLWSMTGIFAVLLFFPAVAAFALMLRQKQRTGSVLALLALLFSYGLFQYSTAVLPGAGHTPSPIRSAGQFAAAPPGWLIFSFCAALAVSEAFLFFRIASHRKNRITRMSIKEATDSLPMGILCYAPNGRILLVNRTMEQFSKMLTGDLLADGGAFAEKLHTASFLPACQVIDAGDPLIVRISDATVWTVTEKVIPYEDIELQSVMVSDITDAYRKTLELRRIQEQVSILNARLVKTNQNIVALTVEQELLSAKVKIHDELGENLLAIKRFILNGTGTEPERAELMERLHENVDFLKEEAAAAADEYELMIGTAKHLGVDVIVSGPLPQTEPLRSVIATGIHECFTNTLRHSHGDTLNVRIAENETQITVVFTNNGEQPTEGFHEKGGLILLRSLTEQAGGQMTVSFNPVLSITLELPKEV